MELRLKSEISHFPSYTLRRDLEETGLTQILIFREGEKGPILVQDTINGYRGIVLAPFEQSVSLTEVFPSGAVIRTRPHLIFPFPIVVSIAVCAMILLWGIAASIFTLAVSGVGLLLTAITALWEINAK
jgi:hypothetical protein